MKIKKIITLATVIALTVTIFTVAPATATFAEESAFFEDFEDYTIGDDTSATLSALMDDGWYMVGENTIYTDTSAAPYQNLTSFAQVVNYGGRNCLMLCTPNQNKNNSAYGLGRKFPGQGNAKYATGNWEINFKFRPYATSTAPVQFLFSMNTLDGSAANARIAQHSLVAAYSNKMYVGYRDYMTSYNNKNSIPQHTLSGSGITLDWYDVKAVVNLDARYYSVEIYKGGKLMARRSPINFNAAETVGFLKFSALGITNAHRVYIDDISIAPVTRETLIYEDDFESITKVETATSEMTLGDATESFAGDSYFEGFTPWRALLSSGKDYGFKTDEDLFSNVVRLGDDPETAETEKSGLVYMPVYSKLVDYKTQTSRGKVRVGFKIKPSIIGNSGFQASVVPEYNVDVCQAFKLADNNGIPVILTDNGQIELDASSWYDADMVLDVINKMATITLKEHSSSTEIADFSLEFPTLTSVAGIVFNAVGGTSVYMDDVKIEYYEYDSSIDLNNMTELMKIGSVMIEDTPVSFLSDISNNSTVNVKVAYVNNSDEVLDSMLFIAYYGDGRLLSTSSVKPASIGIGEKGIKSYSLTVPGADVLDMNNVDKVSICLWKGFKNSYPYCSETIFGDSSAGESETVSNNSSKPVITYSYNNSVLNISGTVNTDSKYMTVQILKPGSSFDAGDELSGKDADALVFYRAQAPVKDGKYSLDVRFDSKDNTDSKLELGNYPTAIYIDDIKQDTESVYLCSRSAFETVYGELNAAAASNDFTEFKNILNNKRSLLNFDSELLSDTVLGDEVEPYFEYVKENPLVLENETTNAEMFNTYVVIQYLNNKKISDVSGDINKLLIADDIKELCDKTITSAEKGKYFTGLISYKNISEPKQLEKSIKEALVLTAAKYGNGYGELKAVLETCGEDLGISAPISESACRALMGKTYKDIDSFKSEYDKNADESSSSSSSGTGGSRPSISKVQVPTSDGTSGTGKITPIKKSFNDIDNYEWAMVGILALADKSIINGVDEDRFEPARNITREEFAKILVGALGASEKGYNGNVFADASDTDWFVKYINIAAELGIVKGTGNGMFGTGYYITRQDMAVMIYNALKYRGVNVTADGFKFDDDGQIADYAKDAVAVLHGMGAINGVTATTFEPRGYATRAQTAKIVYSVLEELQG